MKILIAEDDSTARVILTKRLRNMGHEVIVSEDGAKAWDAFQTGTPHIVITDLEMPNLDGLQLCRMIRTEHHEKYVYIIILTAREGKNAYFEGLDAGADDFLNKPVDMDELAARLRVADRILSMQTEMRQLEGLLPICAWCKKIRDDQGHYHQIETFIAKHSEVKFTHGICPGCREKFVTEAGTSMRNIGGVTPA